MIKLERNYRSTQNILDAAGAVVANNPDRLGKSLSAENGGGANLKYFEGRDANAEAEFVAGELTRILDDDSSLTCAVEYRTNFQSRAFEEVFRRRGIRYKLVGGFSFYNRAEVKDVLAYVRMAMHPEDDVSLLRVLNVPPRGIGKTTVDALRETARLDSSSLWEAIAKFVSGASAGRAVAPLRAFQELIAKLQENLSKQGSADFLRTVLDDTGYMEMLKDRNKMCIRDSPLVVACALAGELLAAPPQASLKTASLESHEGLTISALPWTDPTQYKEKFPKKSPYAGGVLAVQVAFRNDSDESVRVNLERIRLCLLYTSM